MAYQGGRGTEKMIKLVTLFVGLGLLFTFSRAYATSSVYVKVSCNAHEAIIVTGIAGDDGSNTVYDEKTNTFVVDIGVSNSEFFLKQSNESNECRLGGGHVVRVRYGIQEPNFNNTQDAWVSVWFDRKKWISREMVEWTMGDALRASSIHVGEEGITLCQVPGSVFDSEPETANQKPSCAKTQSTLLATKPDVREPELLVDTVWRPGESKITLDHESKLCEAMYHGGNDISAGEIHLHFPDGAALRRTPDKDNVKLQKLAVADQFSMYDIDNSKSSRYVFYAPRSGIYFDYDQYVIFDESGLQRYANSPKKWDDLVSNALAVWPEGWAGCCSDRKLLTKPDSDLSSLTLLTDDHGGSTDLRMGFLHISPFRFKQQTYLLLRDDDDPYMAFVIKPGAANTFEQVCAFKKDQPNF
jgi:hypothetical protein